MVTERCSNERHVSVVRYGFLSMYAFRLVYYLHWHIVWGYLRLQLLF
jgi:hypothetical protein